MNDSKNALFRVNFHIGRGKNTKMPETWLGAYVSGFCTAVDPQLALKIVGEDLISKGYEIIDAEGKIDQMDPHKWDIFIEESWPDYSDHFPKQSDVVASMSSGTLFYSPYAGYDQLPPNKTN